MHSATSKRRARRAARINARLKQLYPRIRTFLAYKTNWQLLVAVMLSAQTTDKQVNAITPALFKRYPGVRDMAAARQGDVEALIRSTGYFRQKARNVIAAAKMVRDDFAGRVPGTMDELLRIPGVARKTANIVLGTAFGTSRGHARAPAFHQVRADQRDRPSEDRAGSHGAAAQGGLVGVRVPAYRVRAGILPGQEARMCGSSDIEAVS